MQNSHGPVVEATRTNADGTAVRWTVVAADERWLIAQAIAVDGENWTTTSAAVVDTLDDAIAHHPGLTAVATDQRVQVRLDVSALSVEEFAARLRFEVAPGDDLPGWCDPDATVRINNNGVYFLPWGGDLVAVVRNAAGEVIGRRRAVHRWVDRNLPSVSGYDELIEIAPGLAVSVIKDSEPEVLSLGTGVHDRSDRTVAWVEHVVEPGILLFEPEVGEPTRRDWLVAREDHCHRFEFCFGDDTDHHLRVRRMAVLHPDTDVDFLWNEMSATTTGVDQVPGQRDSSDPVRTG